MPGEQMPGADPLRDDGSTPDATSDSAPLSRPEHNGVRHALPLFQSLSAIVAELESLTEAGRMRPGSRFKRICELDDYVRAITESALASSTGSIMQPRHYRDPAVFVARDVFGSVLDAYLNCRAQMSLGDQVLAARIARAAAERVKWEQFSGGPPHEGLWQAASEALSQASVAGARATPIDGDEVVHEGAVEQEYLRALAYFSAGYEQLAPDLFGVVNRLVDIALPMLGLYKKPLSGTVYYIDLSRGASPTRFVQVPERADGVRYFSTRRAYEFLQKMDLALKRGELPRELDLIPVERDLLCAALEHLIIQWSVAPPVRRNRRHPVDGALHAVQGYDRVHALLESGDLSDPLHLLFVDVSRGGVGVLMESGVTPAICVGALVAIRPLEGGVWHLEMVQRVWQESGMRMILGLMTLSIAPRVLDVTTGAETQSVLVCDPLLRGEAVRIVAPLGGCELGDMLYATQQGERHELRRLVTQARGHDFAVLAYQVQ
ncbi:MAG: hypothetical protein HYS20_13485 [Rhodocyclales bacterium]|nr:hypothetical protein [Rhodocyclales bacterium]